MIAYSGPRLSFFFSKNLSTASLNPVVVTSDLAQEVPKGAYYGPLSFNLIENLQVSPIGLVFNNIYTNWNNIPSVFPKSGNSCIKHFFLSNKQGATKLLSDSPGLVE